MFLTTRVSEAPLRSMHLELLFAPCGAGTPVRAKGKK